MSFQALDPNFHSLDLVENPMVWMFPGGPNDCRVDAPEAFQDRGGK